MNTDKYTGHTPGPWEVTEDRNIAVVSDGCYLMSVEMVMNKKDLVLMAEAPDLLAEVKRLRKREATFDTFIDSLDVHNEHEWMLIEQIDEIDERLHGGDEE